MYQSILLPTDGSALSEQAAVAAIELARCSGGKLLAFSVAEPYPSAPLSEAALVIDPGIDGQELEAIARARVQRVVELAIASGVSCRGAVTRSFRPHEDIVRAAQEHGCDLIFMASHGRQGLARLLAGSVAGKVLAEATVPVLVFHAPHGG
ncbi:MAG: universal stress protein [Pseudomonadota bacterium]